MADTKISDEQELLLGDINGNEETIIAKAGVNRKLKLSVQKDYVFPVVDGVTITGLGSTVSPFVAAIQLLVGNTLFV